MIRFFGGDCRDVLKTLADRSVQCVVTSPPYFGLRSYLDADHADKRLEIGSEPTPALFVAEMVAVFREVRRVLRDDGVAWLNLGDSYANDAKWGGYSGSKNANTDSGGEGFRQRRQTGMKPKDLLMIPARVAIALCDDGWYLRKDIIWAKPNPMPESVTDRPTSSHEHIFLLAKRPSYFYDAEAVREASVSPEQEAHNQRYAKPYAAYDERAPSTGQPGNVNNVGIHARPGAGGRNLRDVWTIATQPFSDAHFATFPPELVERCVKAGTSERGACPGCGAPWARMLGDRTETMGRGAGNGFVRPERVSVGGRGDDTPWVPKTRATTGWCQTCDCPPADPVPCVVLDPFSGAGTTALVSDRLGRDAIGIDLNPTYGEMARERLVKDAGMFAVFG